MTSRLGATPRAPAGAPAATVDSPPPLRPVRRAGPRDPGSVEARAVPTAADAAPVRNRRPTSPNVAPGYGSLTSRSCAARCAVSDADDLPTLLAWEQRRTATVRRTSTSRVTDHVVTETRRRLRLRATRLSTHGRFGRWPAKLPTGSTGSAQSGWRASSPRSPFVPARAPPSWCYATRPPMCLCSHLARRPGSRRRRRAHRGNRVIVFGKLPFFVGRGSLTCGSPDPRRRYRRIAGSYRTPAPAARRRGTVRPPAQASAAVPAAQARADHRPRVAPPSTMS